ncbi:NmrA family protein [Fusarium oxysporum f. sp. phaseoli]
MKVVVVPASAQTSQWAIQTLLDDSSVPSVIGVYRDVGKVPAGFRNPQIFQAVQGDVSDGSTLDFSGCDAVITLTPPKLDGSDFIAFGKNMATNVQQAVAKSRSVKSLVYVSSQGAQYAEGVGEVRTNHNCERIFETLACDVVFVRNCYFMENWSSALDTINSDNPYFYSTIAPLDYSLPMVSVKDIGKTCAREALSAGTPLERSPRIVYLHGPRNFTVRDVWEAFEKVTGKKIKTNLVDDFVEMMLTFLPGGLLEEEMNDLTNAVRGDDTLVDSFSRMWRASQSA